MHTENCTEVAQCSQLYNISIFRQIIHLRISYIRLTHYTAKMWNNFRFIPDLILYIYTDSGD